MPAPGHTVSGLSPSQLQQQPRVPVAWAPVLKLIALFLLIIFSDYWKIEIDKRPNLPTLSNKRPNYNNYGTCV